ncbi:MAG: HPF/RaiA family ribosome-associated protein, partial [Rhodanobacter sp.]
IAGHEALAQNVEEVVERLLGRFSEQVTRVEVHLSDENGSSKSGAADKRCLLEVRLAGRQPVSVSEQAHTVNAAVTGASHKMIHLLESELGKLRQH